jgi:hypothetical protein
MGKFPLGTGKFPLGTMTERPAAGAMSPRAPCRQNARPSALVSGRRAKSIW